jgi:hypothetical protein
MAAQNQHYVPQFILRQFLSNQKKEQVTVFDKKTGKIFTTGIRNIMAERRFNNFTFENLDVSFEPLACLLEEQVLPTYRRIVEKRRLQQTVDEQANLSLLIAFQFIRTRAYRSIFQTLEQQLRAKVEANGGQMEEVLGWEPLTDDVLKRIHLESLREEIATYAQIISQKAFVLAEPAPKRMFYLGDNPVGLHNGNDYRPYGNLGLGVHGIEIYMPLAANLMLCAWCPSIIDKICDAEKAARKSFQAEAFKHVQAGRISLHQMQAAVDAALKGDGPASLLEAFKKGIPVSSKPVNMDFYNSLQVSFAERYIVCQQGEFGLAKKFNAEFPEAWARQFRIV